VCSSSVAATSTKAATVTLQHHLDTLVIRAAHLDSHRGTLLLRLVTMVVVVLQSVAVSVAALNRFHLSSMGSMRACSRGDPLLVELLLLPPSYCHSCGCCCCCCCCCCCGCRSQCALL
jgi:hypothetical protein